ncbi:hypothetical protein HJC23_007171 [Cyclotella cryptica]|uniref:ABC transporter domain-containing protein n=1 Tax=Cyclotella cryptica TaxID=29204 RepID=A0ABD3QTM7_9STRA
MSSLSSSVGTYDESVASGVSTLKSQLDDLQRRLGRALRAMAGTAEDDKDGGYVNVDFVRTKPKLKLNKCRKGSSKIILHPFYARFPEGSVTALMGPSGAGKTTLLDFLTGMLGDGVLACGTVSLPDSDAYVPQDDRLHSFYTCRTYMEHYSRMSGQKSLIDCCGKGSSATIVDEEGLDQEILPAQSPPDAKVDKLIDDILEEVGLMAQKDTIVGGVFKRGLSGGQKRRLSVALEALSSPLNMFLDEPTSGLDSESALRLMEYLNRYARSRDPATGLRRRVILTIHQPSSRIWELIDNVVLLAQGRLMYQGRADRMADFFTAYGHPVPIHYNPSDHFIEALSEVPMDATDEGTIPEEAAPINAVEMWCKCYKQWSKNEMRRMSTRSLRLLEYETTGLRHSMVIRSSPRKGSFRRMGDSADRKFRNAVELTRRSFESMIRDPIVLGLRIGIYGGISLVLGVLFYGLDDEVNAHSVLIGRTALLYFIIAFCSSMSVAAIPFSIVERAIVEKEVRNHRFHPAFYHVSQAVASLPACFVLSILGLGISTKTCVILFITFYCADATSMFISHIAPELISAICISSGVFGLFTIVMGFLVTPSNMSWVLRWAYYIPFMTYSFRSLMYVYYIDMKFLEGSYVNGTNGTEIPADGLIRNITGVYGEPQKLDGSVILDSFEMSDVNVNKDIIILMVWAVLAHLLSVFYLIWARFKHRRVFTYADKEGAAA